MVHEQLQVLVKTVVDLPGQHSEGCDCIMKSWNEQVVGFLLQNPRIGVSGEFPLVQMKEHRKGPSPLRGGCDLRAPRNLLWQPHHVQEILQSPCEAPTLSSFGCVL